MEQGDERRRAVDRLLILDALSLAFERREELFDLVDSSRSADDARARLQAEWELHEMQATAVMDLQVRRFSNLERQRIRDERNELARKVARHD